jgi:hypothetical protein
MAGSPTRVRKTLLRTGSLASRLIKPVLFSQAFDVDPKAIEQAGLLDPILNSDTRVFIDPLLLSTSGNSVIADTAFEALKRRYSEIVRLVAASTHQGDPAWREAERRLNLQERPETGLGYGGSGTSGSSRPLSLKRTILSTLKEITVLGEKDPQIVSLIGLFEEGVGPDTISDLTTNFVLQQLCEITSVFCTQSKVRQIRFDSYGGINLPKNPFRDAPVVLVPRDILRDLPLAADWDDVSRVINEIVEIRDRVNELLGPITQATLTQKKDALRKAVMSSLATFREFFQEILSASDNYDPNEDPLNVFAFRGLMNESLDRFSGWIKPPTGPSREELERIVLDVIASFRRLVEDNNLWEMLWTSDGKPKRERASQLLFFAVADIVCKANNIDISPETNSGGGPVDFKFSSGYKNRLVVEIKRSTGTIESGYRRQIKIYERAADTDSSIFLIIDVGNIGRKLAKIRAYQKALVSNGLKAPRIEVVDAKRRQSASKPA